MARVNSTEYRVGRYQWEGRPRVSADGVETRPRFGMWVGSAASVHPLGYGRVLQRARHVFGALAGLGHGHTWHPQLTVMRPFWIDNSRNFCSTLCWHKVDVITRRTINWPRTQAPVLWRTKCLSLRFTTMTSSLFTDFVHARVSKYTRVGGNCLSNGLRVTQLAIESFSSFCLNEEKGILPFDFFFDTVWLFDIIGTKEFYNDFISRSVYTQRFPTWFLNLWKQFICFIFVYIIFVSISSIRKIIKWINTCKHNKHSIRNHNRPTSSLRTDNNLYIHRTFCIPA